MPSKLRRSRFPGRKPLDNRKALTGILCVLETGLAWEDFPQELACDCGMNCWRRLRERQQTGVWQALEELLSIELSDANKINWSRVKPDSLNSAELREGKR